MRDRRDPWKWPLCSGLTVALFLATFIWLPSSWIHSFFSPLSFGDRLERQAPARWMILQPPPQVEAVPDRSPVPEDQDRDRNSTPLHQDPDWWTAGWIVRAGPEDPSGFRPGSSAASDSVAILLQALGVERDFMARTRPDSVLATRLFLLQVEDSFRFDELKPYLSAMARARDYADIMSRAADMYDNFLDQEIMTPD